MTASRKDTAPAALLHMGVKLCVRRMIPPPMPVRWPRYSLPFPETNITEELAAAMVRQKGNWPKWPTEEPPITAAPVPVASVSDVIPILPVEEALHEMHQSSVIDFVNAKGFGFVKDREHVTGFQAHHFHAVPQLKSLVQTERWRVQSLELVSLLKHEQPVAYLYKHLPRMDELRDAPTRPLSSFEKQALASLQKGEDLATETATNRIDMLGSIRALNQCLACHRVQRGDLVGAFSYTLVRESPDGSRDGGTGARERGVR